MGCGLLVCRGRSCACAAILLGQGAWARESNTDEQQDETWGPTSRTWQASIAVPSRLQCFKDMQFLALAHMEDMHFLAWAHMEDMHFLEWAHIKDGDFCLPACCRPRLRQEPTCFRAGSMSSSHV